MIPISDIKLFAEELIRWGDDESLLLSATHSNPWFDRSAVRERLNAVSAVLSADAVIWPDNRSTSPVTIAFYNIDRIPLENIVSVLWFLAAGHRVLIKRSGGDDVLLKRIVALLHAISPGLKNSLLYTQHPIPDAQLYILDEKVSESDVNKYFAGKKVYRQKRRTSAAIIDGTEDETMLRNLVHDMCSFFGLGPGNVRKLFLPVGYDIGAIFRSAEQYQHLKDHHHYFNAYQYASSLYLIENLTFFENGFLKLREDTRSGPPTSVVFY